MENSCPIVSRNGSLIHLVNLILKKVKGLMSGYINSRPGPGKQRKIFTQTPKGNCFIHFFHQPGEAVGERSRHFLQPFQPDQIPVILISGKGFISSLPGYEYLHVLAGEFGYIINGNGGGSQTGSSMNQTYFGEKIAKSPDFMVIRSVTGPIPLKPPTGRRAARPQISHLRTRW